jgi:hypothetical protein
MPTSQQLSTIIRQYPRVSLDLLVFYSSAIRAADPDSNKSHI